MRVIIKKATMNDLQSVQELNLKLFEKEHKDYDSLLNLKWTFGKEGIKYFKDRISKDNSCVLIAIVNKQIVGYLCGELKRGEVYRNLPIVAELENTFVLDSHRSKGIGTKLYNRFIKWCKTKKVGKIKVQASAKNELAIHFYRKNNFNDYSLMLETNL